MPGWRSHNTLRRRIAHLTVAAVVLGALVVLGEQATAGAKARSHAGSRHHLGPASGAADAATTTPIKHLVVIFQENVSFDHYFGTYPNATNPSGEPSFTAAPDTPSVNGLTPALLTDNPNSSNPHRLDRSQALTCDRTTATRPSRARLTTG